MFNWNQRFETGIDEVDSQHRVLIDILNRIFRCIDLEQVDSDVIDGHLKELGEYWHQHFTDEQAMMQERGISERHRKLHEMEHHAFAYDVERLVNRRATMEDPLQVAQQSASFIATWLSMHILGVDQAMARQLRAIEAGVDPEDAFARHEDFSIDRRTARAVVDSLLSMWRDAEERCMDLWAQLEATEARSERMLGQA